jgi:hypothetical protein
MTDRSLAFDEGGSPLAQDPPSPNAVPPAPPGAPELLTIGPVTRANAAKVLEQQLGLVWAGILESHGRPAGEPWEVVIEGLHLRRHREAPTDGAG